MTPVRLEMTWRARFYLTVAGFRHGALAASALLSPDLPDVDLGLPIRWWGVVFLVGAAGLLWAAKEASETWARVALGVSAVVTSVWAAGFTAFWLTGQWSPLPAILFLALTLKDLTIVGDPMRSPFEPMLREYADTDPDK